jgi:regulator of sigma D
MTSDDQTLQSHWNDTSALVERWIEDRRELLVEYCDLTEVTDFSDAALNHEEKLEKFCELMVDYVSVGHFEIFIKLNESATLFDNNEGIELSQPLLAKIQITTDQILNFNDKYSTTKDLETLIIDLASLGEVFVQRFADEDTLIDVLHSENVAKLIGEGS